MNNKLLHMHSNSKLDPVKGAVFHVNQLPEEIRCAKTLATFKSSLKTHLFSCAFVE